jgi:hypothetical protein
MDSLDSLVALLFVVEGMFDMRHELFMKKSASGEKMTFPPSAHAWAL